MFKKLGNYLLTGTVIVLPLTVTLFVLAFLINHIGNPVSELIFVPIFRHFDAARPTSGIGKLMIDLASMLIVLCMITAIGVVSRFFITRALIGVSESVINKIPVIGTIYKTVRQIVDTFSKQKTSVFQHAVLVQFPREGLWSVGFVTGSAKGEILKNLDDGIINIFVPTTPNPTSGFLIMVAKEEVKYLDMTVGEALKLIISGGAVVPDKNDLPISDKSESSL